MSTMKRRAFTLIELITVLAITAVLLTIIIIPMIQAFSFTRAAEGFATAQESGRRLIEQITREIENSAGVRDNDGDKGSLAVVVPALSGPVVLVDAGAALDATPDVLRQFALAGWAYARALGVAEPTVGLLSIGSEAGKGDRLRVSADELLADSLPSVGVRYAGPVEGHDLAVGGRAQVVVTDGFTGNVVLKTPEGGMKTLIKALMAAFASKDEFKVHADALLPALFPLYESVDPENTGGAILLGVDGVCIISHGSSSSKAIVNVIGVCQCPM